MVLSIFSIFWNTDHLVFLFIPIKKQDNPFLNFHSPPPTMFIPNYDLSETVYIKIHTYNCRNHICELFIFIYLGLVISLLSLF